MVKVVEREHINQGDKNKTFKDLKKAAKRKIIALRGEALVLGNPRNHPAYYESMVREIIGSGKYWPVVLGTHNSHVAGFPALEEANYVRDVAGDERIRGSRLVVAANIETGQNEEVQAYFKPAKKIFDKLDAQVMFVVRDKDAAQGEERDRKKQHAEFLSLVKDGRIPVILPEGSVEAGRQKPGGVPGEVKGMIPLARGSVRLIVRYIRHQGMEPLLFFVGTTGANRILDPISEKSTSAATWRAFGIKRGPWMSSVIDYPTRADELEKHLQIDGRVPDGAWEQYAGERLAQLIPPNERGVYASPTLLARVPVLRRSTSHLF